MKALVTGATGFIGGNVVRALLRHGYEVRALVRAGSDRRGLEGLSLEVALGDLRDRGSLRQAMRGCEAVLHVGAAYTLWSRDPAAIYESNVGGTENLLEAAREQGVRRVVHTSSESTIAIARNGCLGSEVGDNSSDQLPGDYKKSKLIAERLARKAAESGLPVVIVNPTTPIGAGDLKPTPTGRIVVDFLRRRLPAYVETGMNFVDVEDVAEGHVLALERGKVGERYLLGHENLSLRQALQILERISGLRAPSLRLPLWLALGAAHLDERLAARLGRPPRIPLAGVKAALKTRYFDCSKAVRELGMPQTPVELAFEKAVRWFRDNGYAS